MNGQAVQTAQAIYEAFGRGDVPAILERIAGDVEWDVFADNRAQAAGVPWLAARRDEAGLVEFFATIGSWEMRRFEVRTLCGDDRMAAAEIFIEAVTPGGVLADEEAHVWHVDEDGRVTRFRHYVDTAKHIAVAERAAAAAV